MIKRYLICTSGKQYYVIKFYIIKIDTVLRFGYDIHLITNSGIASMIDKIDQSFSSNPESDAIFTKLSTDKKFSKTISQLEALDVINTLETILRSRPTDKYIRLTLPGAVLYYEINKIKMIYNLIKHFYDNYETIKTEFNKPTVDSSTAEYKPEIISDVKDISSKIFMELTKLSPNNIITFFIIKQISFLYTNQIVDFELDPEFNLNIKVSKFTNNLMLLYNDLNTYINFVPETLSTEEYNKYIKLHITTLVKLLITIYDNQSQLPANDKYLYINFILVLIYIYGFWANGSDFNSTNNLYSFANRVITALKGNTGKIKSIKFTPLPVSDEGESKQVELGTINMLASKYKYLIDIDKDKFVQHVLKDIKAIDKNIVKPNHDLVLNKPRLLDLTTTKLPLYYEVITDLNLSNHRIISKAYHSLLILENSTNLLWTTDIDDMLPKLADIVKSKIVPALKKNGEMIVLNPSTLLIYTNCIEPFIDQGSMSINEKLYLIYQICIPFVHDNYKVNKIIDYFH